MERIVQIVVAAPPNAPSTECDEAIAHALTEDVADEPSGGSSLLQPSAPPLPLPPPPPLPPMAQESAGEQLQAGQPGSSEHTPLEAVSHYDEQLARELQEEELQQLSVKERDRLATLPSLLGESPLAQALSERLAGLAGASFAKLIPRVNSGAPVAAEAASAPPYQEEPNGRPLLEQRLRLFCLVERVVKGDGACQFRSLADQLYRSEKLHAYVRERVCQQLRHHADWYCGHVPGDYRRYCNDMARSSTWGDHVTLQAAADTFGARIWVLTSYEASDFLEIEPRQRDSTRVLLLSFFAEIHYNSLYHADDPPPPPPGAKLLGSRRLHALLLGV